MSTAPQPSGPPANPARRQRGNRILLVLLLAVVLPVGVSLLYTFSPTEYTFLPCPLHQVTGLHCPGCGATRCVHALLHGNLEQALAYNPLFVILLPLSSWGALNVVYSLWTGKPAPGPTLPGWIWITLAVILLIYGIARNIDVYPLNLLAPHRI